MASAIDNAGSRGKVRWLMIGLLFLVAAVSYLDRTNISIAAPLLKLDLGISDVQMGTVFTAFVLGYALTQPIAGRLADRFGAYRVIALGIVWWSVITIATACVSTRITGAFALLIFIRLLLGIGESVIFPASNRLVANWVPVGERGLANGLIFAGVGFGAGVAPPLVAFIMAAHGWRAAFFASAAIGVVALAIWMLLAREKPEQHPLVSPEESAFIAANRGGTDQTTHEAQPMLGWGRIFASRQLRLLTLSYFCFGYVAYIFFTWFFTYLSSVRGLDLKSSGIYGMLPFIAMALASSLGGWASDGLTRRFGTRIGRCMPAAIGMGLAGLFVAIATQVADARLAALVLALGSGSLYLSQSAFWTLSADLGKSSAGSVSGVMNMGNQIGGATVAQVTPIIAAAFGWTGSFMAAAILAVVGAITWLLIDPEASL